MLLMRMEGLRRLAGTSGAVGHRGSIGVVVGLLLLLAEMLGRRRVLAVVQWLPVRVHPAVLLMAVAIEPATAVHLMTDHATIQPTSSRGLLLTANCR